MRVVLTSLLVVFLATSNLLARESPRVFEELARESTAIVDAKDVTRAAPNAK